MDLTGRREQVAAALAAALAPVPVFQVPPSNVTPPCVVVATGRGVSQARSREWEAETTVTVIGPGGDNLAAVGTVEQLLMVCAATVSDLLTSPVTWERPGRLTLGGKDCYAVTLTVTSDVDAPAVPVGRVA